MRQRCLVTFVKLKIILSKIAKSSRTIHASDVARKATAGRHARSQRKIYLLDHRESRERNFAIGVRRMDILSEIVKNLLSTRRTCIVPSAVKREITVQGTAIVPTICRIDKSMKHVYNI
jgi:hypothetical protein